MKKENREHLAPLTLLGRVDKRVIKKLINPTYTDKEDIVWFFVDYSVSEVEINSQYDILLEKETNSLIPGKFKIKLLATFDQFGNQLDSIPKGFQTICRLQFIPELPKQIKN